MCKSGDSKRGSAPPHLGEFVHIILLFEEGSTWIGEASFFLAFMIIPEADSFLCFFGKICGTEKKFL